MNQTQNNIDIQTGTVSFWIKENSILFNDNKSVPLFQVDPKGGSIFIVKDFDNKLKVFFVVLGLGRINIEYDSSSLDPSQRHMIALTWSLEEKILNLYLDGQLVKKQEIKF